MVYHGSYMTLWITPFFSNQQSTGHGKPHRFGSPSRPQASPSTRRMLRGRPPRQSWNQSLWNGNIMGIFIAGIYIYGIQSFIIYEYTLYLIYTYIYIFIYIYIHSFEWGDDQDFLAVLCRHGGGLHPIDGHFTLETYDDSPVETESLPFASSKH